MNLLFSLHRETNVLPNCYSVPAPRGTEELNTKIVISPESGVARRARDSILGTASALALAELEAFASALLSVLLALFPARVAADQSFALELLPQFRIELHQSARDAELHC